MSATDQDACTGRDRLRAALRGEAADRVAWSPLVGGYFQSALPPELARLSGLELHRLVGADCFLRMGGGGAPPGVRAQRQDVRVRQEAAGGPGGAALTTFETPRGTLRGTAVPDEHGTSWRQEFFVKRVEDYEAIEALWDDLRFEPNHEALGAFIDDVGDEGLVVVSGPDQPLVAAFRHREQQALLFDLLDHPGRMRRVLDCIHRRHLEAFAMLAEGPGEVFIQGCSYLGTGLISPALYERYVAPYVRDYADVLHRRGKRLLAHMCGAVWDLLDLAQDAGLDGIESVAPPPVGNTPIGPALDRVGPCFCLIGGIDPVLLGTETPARVQVHARQVLEAAAGHANFILATGDAVAAGTTMEQLRAVTNAVRDVYGSVP